MDGKGAFVIYLNATYRHREVAIYMLNSRFLCVSVRVDKLYDLFFPVHFLYSHMIEIMCT